MPADTVIRDADSARDYDAQARATHWHVPEVIFGLTYDFLAPGQTLLDLGIGSGLSSALFHRAGLRVFGLDASSEVLQVCAVKNIAVELKQHDLRDLPLPYPSRAFDHVLCVGVLNSFPNLTPLFHEIARVLRNPGYFSFTVEPQAAGEPSSYAINPQNVSAAPDPTTAVQLYRHSDAYIAALLAQNDLAPVKQLRFVAFSYPAERRDVFFTAYVAARRDTTD